MTKTGTQPWLTLEREGLLLMLSFPVVVVAAIWMAWDIHEYAGLIPLFGWLMWLFGWATKGGIPPRY